MRYSKLGLLFGLLASSCGDDSTGDDTSVATIGGPTTGSETGGPSTGGDDLTTNGSVTSEGTSSSGATEGSDTVGSTSSMDTTAGTSVGETGTGDTFPCGDEAVCLVDTQYCEQTVGGAVGNPPSYACMDLPEGCVGGGTCDCVQSVQCSRICEMIEGGVQVTCQAP